jgi:F0F1-type ATP synthase delta subunit
MSASTKLVKTYAKSLFQNLNKGDNNSTQDDSFSIAKITSSEQKNFLPDIFIVGEELLLLRATLISSEKLSIVFKDPTYSESQKLEILSSIFPGLTITTKSFLKVLTERTHLSLLPLISEEFTTILLKIKNTTKVNLIAASQLETIFG